MKNKLAIGALVLLIVAFIGQCIHKRQNRDAIEFAPVLKENEREKIVIDSRAGTVKRVVRRDQKNSADANGGSKGQESSEQIVTDISGVRKVAVTIDKDGNVSVYAPTSGVIFEPGLAAFYSDDKFRLGLDAQVFYWRKWGVNIGAGSTLEKPYTLKAYIAGSYNVWSNTSLFVGITHTKEAGFGLRIRF